MNSDAELEALREEVKSLKATVGKLLYVASDLYSLVHHIPALYGMPASIPDDEREDLFKKIKDAKSDYDRDFKEAVDMLWGPENGK